MKILDRIRNGVNRVTEGVNLFKKDVFELNGVPAFREYYTLFNNQDTCDCTLHNRWRSGTPDHPPLYPL